LGEADPKDTTRFKALAGMAIKINPHEAGSYADDAGLLRHELTHFLLRDYSGSSPKWLSEGVATWIQYYPDSFATTGLRGPLPAVAGRRPPATGARPVQRGPP